MGFQALLVREDYYGVLKRTLEEYYKDKYGEDVYVGYEYREGAKEMVMNPKLGMIYRPLPCKAIRNYIYKSYNIRNNVLKNIAAKLFVWLSTHSRSLFTLPEKLYVYPSHIVGDSVIFSYLNRSIRIFDFDQNTTVSIKKKSFTSKFFDNQMQFRLKYTFDFVPKIISHSENWFEEFILDGRSLARETDSKAYENGLNVALDQMTIIQNASFQEIDCNAYVSSLTKQINSLLYSAKRVKGIFTYQYTEKYIDTLISAIDAKNKLIPVAESHGDFQAGNILLSKDKTWIIDWETHAIRSIWFDAMTIKFGTRYYGGIKDLMLNGQNEETKIRVLGKYHASLDIRTMIAIFLLEDLLFNLEDMMELPSTGGKDSFDGYMNDIITSDIPKYLIG